MPNQVEMFLDSGRELDYTDVLHHFFLDKLPLAFFEGDTPPRLIALLRRATVENCFSYFQGRDYSAG